MNQNQQYENIQTNNHDQKLTRNNPRPSSSNSQNFIQSRNTVHDMGGQHQSYGNITANTNKENMYKKQQFVDNRSNSKDFEGKSYSASRAIDSSVIQASNLRNLMSNASSISIGMEANSKTIGDGNKAYQSSLQSQTLGIMTVKNKQGKVQSNSSFKNKSDLRTQPHSPYQIGRATASNFNKPSGNKTQLNNQLSDKSFHKGQGAAASNVGGIDMTKLQQLKAYQPPKLDYLAQMKRGSNQVNRGTLISADASNINNNPRLMSKQMNDRQSSINRNDPNRDSLQSRLIERIHSKKMNKQQLHSIKSAEPRKIERSDSKKDDKSTERRVIEPEKQQIAQEEDVLEEGIDEVGIQADDEDNDQIETERAINPGEKRQQELQKLMFQKMQAGATALNLAPYVNDQELFQIKESVAEGGLTGTEQGFMSSSALLSEQNSSRNPGYSNSTSNAQVHPHPTQPDKLVTASGHIITRPKSKQQSKKQRQQAQLQPQQPHSKFSELRKLQSQNTKSNQALDALRSMNQQESQFKQVKEEQENEDNGSDGQIYKADKLSDEEIRIPDGPIQMRNTVSGAFYDSKKQVTKKQSVVKNYGDITNQFFGNNQMNNQFRQNGVQKQQKIPIDKTSTTLSCPNSHRDQDPRAVQQPMHPSQIYQNNQGVQNYKNLTQSQDGQPQIYMKKFAATSSNFYRTSQEQEQITIPQKDQSNSLNSRQTHDYSNMQKGQYTQQQYYKQYDQQSRSNPKNYPHNVYNNNNTAYGFQQQFGQSPAYNDNFNQNKMGNHSLGRNTFYVSDYQLQKQSREFNNQSMGRRQKKQYVVPVPDVSTAQGSYNMHPDTQLGAGFIKPRAISRQADAHIRIEVHKDQRIIHHLQGEKQENMNLMFYNFNDFNNPNAPNGRRPTAGENGRRPAVGAATTQGGMRTQNNFYKSKNLLEEKAPEKTANIHEQQPNINYAGDRVPTRERQYRSAHQNVRRRDITRQQYHQQQIAAAAQTQNQQPQDQSELQQ